MCMDGDSRLRGRLAWHWQQQQILTAGSWEQCWEKPRRARNTQPANWNLKASWHWQEVQCREQSSCEEAETGPGIGHSRRVSGVQAVPTPLQEPHSTPLTLPSQSTTWWVPVSACCCCFPPRIVHDPIPGDFSLLSSFKELLQNSAQHPAELSTAPASSAPEVHS